jgi:RNA polymerase sigma-70 factor (ECF subfamily)
VTTLLTGRPTLRSGGALDDDVDLARDRVLVTRAQEGDRTAFDDLYLRYYRRLYRFCLRRLHDTHESEDVAQEAFSRAWRALPNFGGDRRFYPWLSVIASHLCTDVLRRRNRSTPVAEFHQGNVASTEDGGEELMVASVDCDLVAKAFQRLSERHQRILNLREGSGWSYQRIADHEGVGITAVETLLWRARQALKREFAALAGSDGRVAAWTGGLFSLSMLRKLLQVPVHAARRIGHLGPAAAVGVGSAAAATAVMFATSVGSPPHPATPPVIASPTQVVAAGVTPAQTQPPVGGLRGPSPRSLSAPGSGAAASGTSNLAALPPIAALPTLPGGGPQPPLPGLGNAVNGVNSAIIGGVAPGLRSAVGSIGTSALAPATSSAQNLIDTLLGSLPGTTALGGTPANGSSGGPLDVGPLLGVPAAVVGGS